MIDETGLTVAKLRLGLAVLGIKHPAQVAWTPEMFAEHREMPPGPAFIPARHYTSRTTDQEREWIRAGRMIWQPATDWTGAGWVRPRGVDNYPQ